jgi:hypothetical protein
MRFTEKEIKNWIQSLDDYQDVKYCCSEENILKANLNINDKIWIPKGNAGKGCYGTISSFQNDCVWFKEFNECVYISELISDKIDKINY